MTIVATSCFGVANSSIVAFGSEDGILILLSLDGWLEGATFVSSVAFLVETTKLLPSSESQEIFKGTILTNVE